MESEEKTTEISLTEELSTSNALEKSIGVSVRKAENIVDPKIQKIIKDCENNPVIIAKYLIRDNPGLIRVTEDDLTGGRLYLFNGKYYDFLSETDLDAIILNFCLKYNVTKAFGKVSLIQRVLNVYPDIPKIKKINPFENYLSLNNGILNIHTKAFFPHGKGSADFYFDYALTIDYDPDATKCPNFIKFLNDVLSGEEDTIANIIRLGGYLLDTSCKAKKCFFFDGNGGCLDKDTYISYDVESNGKRINHKGGSIEMLYNRFHGEELPRGKGGYHLRSQDKNLAFYVPSINENNSIFSNRIVDVIKSGVKKCYRLTTKEGKTIIATGTHKFFNGEKYISLNKLVAGDKVYIHNNTHFKNEFKPIRVGYKEVLVKYHQSRHIKVVNNCVYYRVKKCRLVIEAKMNGLSYDDYVKALNTLSGKEICLRFVYLRGDYDVHHINHNRIDDRLENLRVMIGTDHDKLHASENYNKMRFIAVPDYITSIEYVGKRETYDIKCLDPYNNFIANGLVVHNSGKSTLIDAFTMFFPERTTKPVVTSLNLEELSGAGFDKEDLIYSRFNQCAETRKAMYNSEFLKEMVTGDIIKVSRKYDKAYTFRYQGKVILVGNGLPKFNDTSDGIYRRIMIITFRNQYKSINEIKANPFSHQQRIFPVDVDMPEKIKAEASAILNLFIGGLIDLRNNNYQFVESETSVRAMKDFRRESDTVREFLEDNYVINLQNKVSLNEIFIHFRSWYMDNVQDTKAMRFRSAELGKRIREIYGVEPCGRIKVVDSLTNKTEYFTAYPLSRKIILEEEVKKENERLVAPEPEQETQEPFEF